MPVKTVYITLNINILSVVCVCNDHAHLEDGIPAYSAMSQVKEARIFFPPGPSCVRMNTIA